MSLTFDWKNQSKPVMGHEKDYVHKMHIVFFKILVFESYTMKSLNDFSLKIIGKI